MKNIHWLTGVSASLLVACSSASAFLPDSFLEFSGSGGYALYELPDSQLHTVNPNKGAPDNKPTISKKDHDNGGITFGGNLGYTVNVYKGLNIGGSLGYYDNGESEYKYSVRHGNKSQSNDVTISSSDFDITAKVEYEFNTGFELFGRAGFARVSQHTDKVKGDLIKTDNPKPSKSRDVTEYRMLIGAGVDFQFPDGLSLGVSADHISGEDPGVDKFRNNGDRGKSTYGINRLLVDLAYRFNVT